MDLWPGLTECWLQGMDVVCAIAALPRVKDNSESPFFKAGKASGGWQAYGLTVLVFVTCEQTRATQRWAVWFCAVVFVGCRLCQPGFCPEA
jgi:hypothetical protein